jgi:hypothetical protein
MNRNFLDGENSPRGFSRFVAEIEVSRVEKGEGITSGSAIHVRFSSPMTIQELETERVYSGCGDEKRVPIPGQRVRVHARLEGTLEYKAR